MTDQASADMVRASAAQVGVPVAAHNLRRTFAKLAMKGGARLEQIQLSWATPASRPPSATSVSNRI
jgi:site-specific recombinase XerD